MLSGATLAKTEAMNKIGAVSPIALDRASIEPVSVPGNAYGIT
jgi:hypothetical protein